MINTGASRPIVSLVLPAFNEAAILEDNFAALESYLRTLGGDYRFEVLIVNDGSSDGTREIAEAVAAKGLVSREELFSKQQSVEVQRNKVLKSESADLQFLQATFKTNQKQLHPFHFLMLLNSFAELR